MHEAGGGSGYIELSNGGGLGGGCFQLSLPG